MGSATERVPRLSAGLYARVSRRVPELVKATIIRLPEEIPFYRLIPVDIIEGEATESISTALAVFLRSLRDGTMPTPQELAVPLAAAAHRAQEQVPLAAILAAYHLTARVAWESLSELARPDEREEVVAAGIQVLRYLQAVVPAVADVYLEERQAIHGEEREARRALITALLAGEDHSGPAERAQITVAPAYVVLQLLVVREGDPSERSAVAARRRIRRMQSVLDSFSGQAALSALDSHGGVALLPAAPDSIGRLTDELAGLVESLGTAAGAPIVAGASVADPASSVPSAGTEAEEVADLARSLGRPPGVYRLDDVLLEYQVTRRGPGRELLAAKVAELAHHPPMLDALRSWIAHEHDRRSAAAALHIHPNTLDYRLSRVAQLTGLDPLAPSSARVLAAALLVHEIARSGN